MLQRIDLLRHGEPVGGRMYRGKIDDPLSKKGWCEMNAFVADVSDWDIVYHSPLLRCSEFAADLSNRLGIPAVEDDRLQEIGFGVWEGKTAEEIRQQDDKALMRFYLDPVNHQPEGAERLRDFYLRVSEVWDEIIDTTDHERPLIVTHAGVMRAIVVHVLKAPLFSMYRMQIPSAGMVSIRFSKERPPTVLF